MICKFKVKLQAHVHTKQASQRSLHSKHHHLMKDFEPVLLLLLLLMLMHLKPYELIIAHTSMWHGVKCDVYIDNCRIALRGIFELFSIKDQNIGN